MYNLFLAWLHGVMNHIIPCPGLKLQGWHRAWFYQWKHLVTRRDKCELVSVTNSASILGLALHPQPMPMDGWWLRCKHDLLEYNQLCLCQCHMSPHQKVKSWNGLTDDGVCMFSVKSIFILLVFWRHYSYCLWNKINFHANLWCWQSIHYRISSWQGIVRGCPEISCHEGATWSL